MSATVVGMRGRLILVLAIAAIARVVALILLRDDLAIRVPLIDAHYYLTTAHALAHGEGWPAGPHFMAPIYPLLLSWLYRFAPEHIETVQWAQLLVGLATTALVYICALRLDRRAGLPAGLFYALCGPAIVFENLILMEALLAFSLAVVVWAAGDSAKNSTIMFAIAGLALGIATAGRPIFILLLPLLLVLALRSGERHLGNSALWIALLAFLVVVVPPTVRNWRETGQLSFVTVSGGLNLYVGNNPAAKGLYSRPPGLLYLEIDPTGTKSASRLAGRPLDPGEASRFFADRAVAFITSNPGSAARLILQKAGYLVSPDEVPQIESMADIQERQPVLRLFGLVGFPLIFPLALLGMWGVRKGRRTVAVCIGVLIAGASAHLIFFSTGRYRAALLPALAILAGFGVVRLYEIVSSRTAWHRLWPVVLGVLLLLAAPRYDRDAFRPWAYYQSGVRFDRLGAPRAAAEMYTKALEADSTQGESWHNLAATKAKQDLTAEAIADYRTALEYLGEHPLTLYNLAVLYGRMGMDERALEHFDRSLAVDPSDSATRVDRGVALYRLGRRDEAFDEWRRVARTAPEEQSLGRTIGQLKSMGVALPEDLLRMMPAEPSGSGR